VYAGGIVVHPLTFPLVARPGTQRRRLSGPSARGATVRVRASGAVDRDTLAQRITASLARAGVPASEVTIECVEAFERQASGKLKRFFPLSPPETP
jgi:hypothetical protein